MTDEKFTAFANRLEKVDRHVGRTARKQGLTCYRIYDHDLPEFPFAIDRYEDVLHLAEYKRRHGMDDDAHAAWLDGCKAVAARVCTVPEETVFVKQRQRKAGRQGQYERQAAEKIERIVQESGLSFIVNLTEYLDTGLFLDHRITRGLVRDQSNGLRVLNLFCYTGSFSVYAAAGGAKHVTSVDLSNTYLHWAKRNLQYNKLYAEDRHAIVHADVLQWLEAAPRTAYDLIICDPPTFSNSKRMDGEFDVQRDHAWLIRQMLRTLAPGGKVYFSNNFTGFRMDELVLEKAAVKDITKATTPFDFAGKLKRVCFEIGHRS